MDVHDHDAIVHDHQHQPHADQATEHEAHVTTTARPCTTGRARSERRSGGQPAFLAARGSVASRGVTEGVDGDARVAGTGREW
jgi:hypothetical protein